MALTSAALTARIQTEFETAWLEIKGTPPPPPAPDLEVLLTAVARGVLGYLKDEEDALITRLEVTDQGQEKSLTSVDATLGIGD